MKFAGIKEQVIEYLKVHIINGDLSPGQKLNEIEFAYNLNISRGPLREAFRLLENDGLIISIPRKGCYVTELSLEDCIEIFQIRKMVECFSIDLLENKNITDLPELALSLEKTGDLQIPSTSDPYEKFQYVKMILDFHIKLVKSAGNFRLNHIFKAIFSSLARYRSTYIPWPSVMSS